MKSWLGLLPALLLLLRPPPVSQQDWAMAALVPCLDAAALRLPYFGLFSTAPVLLAVLAWRQQGALALGAAGLGLLLRGLIFRQGRACCWELGSRALFCRILLQAGNPLGLIPAALLAEGWLWLGAQQSLSGKTLPEQRAFQEWVRYDRYILPHRLVVYCLAPLTLQLAQSAPLYLLCLAPVLFGLHRVVQGEGIRLELRQEELLVAEASEAQKRLKQVAGKLTNVQHRLKVSQQKESLFWDLGLQLVKCRGAAETARLSLDYLVQRMGCGACAFWRRQNGQLQLLAGSAPASLEIANDSNQLLIELGELGLLYCSRQQPFAPEDRELLVDLSGIFTLGLQSVSLVEEQARVDLNALISDCLQLTRPVLASAGVELASRLEPLEPIQGNASQLLRVLASLILNGPAECVEVYSLMQGRARTILVRHNGPGLSELAELQKLVLAQGGKLSTSRREGEPGTDFLMEF